MSIYNKQYSNIESVNFIMDNNDPIPMNACITNYNNNMFQIEWNKFGRVLGQYSKIDGRLGYYFSNHVKTYSRYY